MPGRTLRCLGRDDDHVAHFYEFPIHRQNTGGLDSVIVGQED